MHWNNTGLADLPFCPSHFSQAEIAALAVASGSSEGDCESFLKNHIGSTAFPSQMDFTNLLTEIMSGEWKDSIEGSRSRWEGRHFQGNLISEGALS